MGLPASIQRGIDCTVGIGCQSDGRPTTTGYDRVHCSLRNVNLAAWGTELFKRACASLVPSDYEQGAVYNQTRGRVVPVVYDP